MRTRTRAAHSLAAALLFALLLVATGGCSRATGGITVAGSTSVQPFAELLAEEYAILYPAEIVNVQGGGSSAGIEAVLSGAAEIGMSSRELKGEELKLVRIEIARDAIAVIVHPSNPVGDLTLEQVREIFSGKVARWSQLGGPDREIVVVTREEGSGTRGAFQDLVLGKNVEVASSALVQDSNGAVRQLVSSDSNAIGYVSLGLVNHEVKAISLDGIAASAENVAAKTYTLVRPFLFVELAERDGPAHDFVEFVLSEQGQASLQREGLLPTSGGR